MTGLLCQCTRSCEGELPRGEVAPDGRDAAGGEYGRAADAVAARAVADDECVGCADVQQLIDVCACRHQECGLHRPFLVSGHVCAPVSHRRAADLYHVAVGLNLIRLGSRDSSSVEIYQNIVA